MKMKKVFIYKNKSIHRLNSQVLKIKVLIDLK